VLPRHRSVHVTPTAAKAAAGAVEHLPISVAPGVPTALDRLRRMSVFTVGLDPTAPRSIYELGDEVLGAIALVLGGEERGLSQLARRRCDALVAIPRAGRLGSLNVSAACAVACYEIARRRNGAGTSRQ
jgi:23S rRNA (guanosine2251-2'-O)-methyltransferase